MYDQAVLKQLQLTELEIMKAIRLVCEKHSLEYYLIGGTLLGAIRHRGFIPWDDDMDIVMPREDYEKFIDLAPKELGSKYFLQSYRTDENYWLPFAKVRKNNTVFLEEDSIGINANKGIFVDIFPLDYSSEMNGRKLARRARIFSYLRFLVKKKQGLHLHGNLSVRDKFILFITKQISGHQMLLLQQRYIKRHNGNEEYFVNFGSQYGVKKQTMPISRFRPGVKVEFEGELFSAPNDSNYVLKRIYGENYMMLPPEEKRVSHMPLKISFDDTNRNDM